MRLQRHAIVPNVLTDYVAIHMRRKSQQHGQVLSLLRAMRWKRHTIVPDVITDYAAITTHRKSQQHNQWR